MENYNIKYFLAANSCEGFVSMFPDCYDVSGGWRAYIIKGGPGTGKSSFMKLFAKKFTELNEKVIFCPCSSDPDSLDAVIIPNKKLVIMDGTAPHVVEPKDVGICEEILNFGQFWNSHVLRESKEEILNITKQHKNLHKSASRHIKAAGQFILDNFKISEDYLNSEKALNYAQNICKKHIPPKTGKSKEWVRFLCGVTPDGVVSFTDTILKETQNNIIISDIYGSATKIITSYIREHALKNGYEIIAVKNPFFPSLLYDHIIIPELSFSVAREYDYHIFNSTSRRVHALRFYYEDMIKAQNNRLKLNRRFSNELLISATEILKKAKSVHDSLEKYYIAAMDFEKLNDFAVSFINER